VEKLVKRKKHTYRRRRKALGAESIGKQASYVVEEKERKEKHVIRRRK